MTPPVLFIIFNRPDLVEQTFKSIRTAKPKQLFIAADGPRPDRTEEAEMCEICRSIVSEIDWDCEVKTAFSPSNLGCRERVESAIDWFFQNVDAGIILEDDCVADLSFFTFCDELLEKYHDDERVMTICGTNLQQGQTRGDASYYFSVYFSCWGWATWRRAWALHDRGLRQWPSLKASHFLHGFLRPIAARFWENNFDSVYNSSSHVWDFQWSFSCFANSGLSIIPNSNLISNVGFDERATHTSDPSSKGAKAKLVPLEFPLRHPPSVCRNVPADHFAEAYWIGSDETHAERNLATRIIGRLNRLKNRFIPATVSKVSS